MQATRLVADSLWRCLCPGVDAAGLQRALGITRPTSKTSPNHCARRIGSFDHSIERSHLGRWLRKPQKCQRQPRPQCDIVLGRQLSPGCTAAVVRNVHTEASRVRSESSDDHQSELRQVRALVMAKTPPYRHELDAASTPAIYAALRQLQAMPAQPPHYNRIDVIVRYLLEVRRETLSPPLFEALMRANCHPSSGSAISVRDLLRAHKVAGIEGTPGMYHGALAALAVHPDYLLRNKVLREMKARWIELTPEDMQNVALGLLRDGQYERALDQLDYMIEATHGGGGYSADGGSRGGVSGSNGNLASVVAGPIGAVSVGLGGDANGCLAPPWLLDLFIYVLGQEGFLDDALRIANHRLLKDGDHISPNVWYFLLDECCRRSHYEGLRFVWFRAVRLQDRPLHPLPQQSPQSPQPKQPKQYGTASFLLPSDAMGLDILNMAARHNDAALAADIMQILAARGTKLGIAHFEAMLDCYAGAGATPQALQALCIMHNAGIVPDQGSTRSLFQSLTARRDNDTATATASRLDTAAAALFELKTKYGSVPVAAFNVVVEAMLHVSSAAQSSARNPSPVAESADAEAEVERPALDLYRQVRQLCPAGPDRATFRLLFRYCRHLPHLNFLLHEMRAFGLQPDTDMVDRLVYENASHGSLDLALRCMLDWIASTGGGHLPSSSSTAAPLDSLAAPTSKAGTNSPTNTAIRIKGSRPLPWISRRTAVALAERCVHEEDARLWAVADAGRTRGKSMDAIIREIVQDSNSNSNISLLARRRLEMQNAYGVPHAVSVEEEGDLLGEASDLV